MDIILSTRFVLMRMAAVTRKEILALSRERLIMLMVVGAPLVQLLLFGYAINTNVRDIPVGIVNHSMSQDAKLLIEAVKATQVAKVKAIYNSVNAAEDAIRAGKVRAALIIPSGFERRQNEKIAAAQWIVDGSETAVSTAMSQLRTMPLDQKFYSAHTPTNFEVTIFYNPEKRSAISIIPGLVGTVLTFTLILATSITVVRERERGHLEMLITTPVKPWEMMFAQILPYVIVGIIQAFIILFFGSLIFNVPITGDIFQIFVAVLIFIIANLTLGLLISTIARTQFQAQQIVLFLLMPSIMVSGFVFPFEGMPRPAQIISEFLPITHFLRIIRGMVLRGADLLDMISDIGVLLAYIVITFTIATIRFKKTLD